MRRSLSFLPIYFLLGISLFAADPGKPEGNDNDVRHANRLLGRGINLGNALDAPKEGEWGVTLEEGYFEAIKKAGFNSVRLPVRWSAHAGDDAPYEIDSVFLKRVDWAVDQALKRGLVVVLNVHHFKELYGDPDKYEPKLVGLWKQLAEHYRDHSDHLYFELLNEPSDKLSDERWERMLPRLLETVRPSNPKRTLIVGPGHWNNLDSLDKLILPEKDHHLIVTFHYYNPFPFTHQEADWIEGSKKWKGTTWTGTLKETDELAKDFAKAEAWSKKNQRPLFVGEFGSYSAAEMESRARWTRAVAREAEKHGFSWAYWEFGSSFGVYDPRGKAWREPLLKALQEDRP